MQDIEDNSKYNKMIDLSKNVALSASILALLSFISICLMVCIFLVFWSYRSNERRKSKWANSPSELRTGWLLSDRKLLVPGQFSAKAIQPDLQQESDDTLDEMKTESSADRTTSFEDWTPCGKIFFILRYLVEREELMVRLVQLEGFSSGVDVYSADSAYVDVQLQEIGSKKEKATSNPPKLDIALQQVYYFIISQDQLFSYKLVFKVNTFDEAFRRTVSGEVEVNLFDELGKQIFTGAEVILSKAILPASQTSSYVRASEENLHQPLNATINEKDDLDFERSPISSPLSWDDECDMSSTKSSGPIPYEDLSSGGVQWHRLSGDSWEEKLSIQWPHLSDSVVSVPSSFQFMTKSVNIDFDDGNDGTSLPDQRLSRRSISESYIPHYGRLSPPPKNFYHLVPTSLAGKQQRSPLESPFTANRPKPGPEDRASPARLETTFTFDRVEQRTVTRKRSLSLPSMAERTSQRIDDSFSPGNWKSDVMELKRRSRQTAL